MSFTSRAVELLAELGTGPVFVHSDVFRTSRLVNASRNKRELLDAHTALLKNISGVRGLWLPAFNYEFPRSRVFDVTADPAQVGPIPEHFRMTMAEWRTPVPMFSVSGSGTSPEVSWGENTDPFGEDSIFGRLVHSDGIVLCYGDTFACNTIVHYTERQFGGPPYRYDKVFPGEVIDAKGARAQGSLKCHVRPLGGDLDYDWAGLLQMALGAGVCRPVPGNPEVIAASARELCNSWIMAMRNDPLALLDSRSRAWVEPTLDKLGRRFTIGDFESPEPLSSVPWHETHTAAPRT